MAKKIFELKIQSRREKGFSSFEIMKKKFLTWKTQWKKRAGFIWINDLEEI